MASKDNSLLNAVLTRLFTLEDTLNVHKTLGFLCLANYVYRFAMVGSSDMGFGPSLDTVIWILLHTLLSVSSLIFKLPKKRILEGSRIWPEYRLHSIVFACRSLACMLLIWAEQYSQVEEPNYLWNVAIIFGTIIAADAGTWWVGEHSRSSTINDLQAPLALKYFFSVMQFHATTNCLVGVRKYSTQFIYVWIIQFTAFILTLRRKNIVPHYSSVIFYGVMLSFGFFVNMFELFEFNSFCMVNAVANIAAFLRIGCRIPKYLLWGLMSVFVFYGRNSTGLGKASPMLQTFASFWPIIYGISIVLVISLGVYKIQFKVKYSSITKPKNLNGHSHANGNGHSHANGNGHSHANGNGHSHANGNGLKKEQ